jgi:asparagine synthase (glutamine-hydrolysing)
VEYAATLPTALRLRRLTTKYLLKKVAERYVPPAALHRRKRGFVMPASRWLRGELAPVARATIDSDQFHDRGWLRPDAVRRLLDEHTAGTRDWGQQIWTLLVLEVWARLTLDGTMQRGDSLTASLSEVWT